MILSKDTACNKVDIWQPRWHDRTVLIAKFKVGTHNEITFSKTKSMPEKYYMSGEKIKTYPTTSNGKIECYIVPIDDLEVLERQ